MEPTQKHQETDNSIGKWSEVDNFHTEQPFACFFNLPVYSDGCQVPTNYSSAAALCRLHCVVLIKLISKLFEAVCLSFFLFWDFGIMLSPDVGLTLAVFLTVFQCHIIFLPFHVFSWFYPLSIANLWEAFYGDFKLPSKVWFLFFSAVNCRSLCVFIYDSVDHVTSPKPFKFLKIVCWLTSTFSHVSMKSTMTDLNVLLLRFKQPRYSWYLGNNENLCLISGSFLLSSFLELFSETSL